MKTNNIEQITQQLITPQRHSFITPKNYAML